MMNKDRATAERLIGTGLDGFVAPLADLTRHNLSQSLVEQVIEFALLVGYETGVARAPLSSISPMRRPWHLKDITK